ncbi:hypothetical protein BDZ45DRAFT_749263 [Acephala macrosclerotiorum]|nr:hypothetical protein BDZ45DRAFT_749263 [Acephala macrosclerotiorum]
MQHNCQLDFMVKKASNTGIPLGVLAGQYYGALNRSEGEGVEIETRFYHAEYQAWMELWPDELFPGINLRMPQPAGHPHAPNIFRIAFAPPPPNIDATRYEPPIFPNALTHYGELTKMLKQVDDREKELKAAIDKQNEEYENLENSLSEAETEVQRQMGKVEALKEMCKEKDEQHLEYVLEAEKKKRQMTAVIAHLKAELAHHTQDN